MPAKEANVFERVPRGSMAEETAMEVSQRVCSTCSEKNRKVIIRQIHAD
jgi:hypothetical protein